MKKGFLISAIVIVATAFLMPIHAQDQSTIFIWRVIVPIEQSGKVRTCPICGASLPESDIEPDGEIVMEKILLAGIKSLKSCRLYFSAAVLAQTEDGKAPDLNSMVKVAKEKGANALLAPVLLRYHQLVGGKFAASSPAAVAFHLHLIRVEDSKMIWNYTYNETQRPLSENLIEIGKLWKRRFKWVRVEQLLVEGMDKAIRDFPGCEEVSP